MRKIEELYVVWNITHNCNFACKYCYYNEQMITNPGFMSLELAELFIKRVAESTFQRAQFVFHGGEPLTLGLKYFEKIIKLQKKYLKEKKCKNVFQTNGSLINQDLIDFAKENDFSFGVSLDCLKEVHDSNRVFKNGHGTYDKVYENLLLLADNKMPYNILVVCSDLLAKNKEKVYRFLSSLERLENVDFLMPHNKPLKLISQGSYSSIILKLFDEWFDDSKCRFNIRVLHSIILSLLGLPQSFCIFKESCITNNPIISIDPYGNIFPCDCSGLELLGNIVEDSIDDLIYQNPIREKLGYQELKRIEACRFCKWFRYCHGGCLANQNEVTKENDFCHDLKDIFHYIQTKLMDRSILNNEGVLNDCNIDLIKNNVLRNDINRLNSMITNININTK